LWKEQPSWPSESLIPMPGCTVKKTNRGPMCTFYLCLNKPSKTAKKKKKDKVSWTLCQGLALNHNPLDLCLLSR
jgi:hypothetical protein